MTSFAVANQELGIYGICDMVVFAGDGRIYPVEYKVRKTSAGEPSDIMQVTAQVLCLEEMFGVSISQAAFYYADIKHREYMTITKAHRQQLRDIVSQMRELQKQYGIAELMPKRSPKCRYCSLVPQCFPHRDAQARKMKLDSVHDAILSSIEEEMTLE